MLPPLSSPLSQPASVPVLRRLLAAKMLTLPEAEAIESQVRRDLPWKTWLDRGLLSLGVVLILSGIGYFFAHNWNHLTDTDKLVLAAGSVFLSLIGATWAGLDRFPGKILLLAASVLVGVFLGVFGQVYQTGADTYELYTTWALLVFLWVALGRFMPLWIFWMALLNFALGYLWPVHPLYEVIDDLTIFRQETISLFLLNGAALVLREIAGRRDIPWMDKGWSALILLAGTMAAASVETIWETFRTWDDGVSAAGAVIACMAYAVVITGLGYYYSKLRYSLPALAIVTLSTCIVLTSVTVRLLNFDHADNNAGIWLIAGVIILAIFGGGVFFLRTQRLTHQQRS
jgi:uncharacterized membrane protein